LENSQVPSQSTAASEPINPGSPSSGVASMTVQMVAAGLARLILNTARRMVYTFAPAFSRALGVPLTSITSLIAVSQGTGLLAPLFGPWGDRIGYRPMLLASVGLLSAGLLMAGLWPVYIVLLLALILCGLAKSIFDPTLQAFVGKQVPFRRRGQVMGLIEMAWAGSTLVGIPLVGLLLDRIGWRAPFFVLGGLSLTSLVILYLVIPANELDRDAVQPTRIGFGQAWRLLSGEKRALAALGVSLLIAAANDMLFVIYGAWLESFGLTVAALGAATIVIGVAEISGESLTALISDRLGLKRSVLIGLALSTLAYLLLPLAGHSLPLALAGLFLAFIAFEFTVVTSFSLFSELLPQARATMMSSNMAALSIGRILGTAAGGFVWLTAGLWGIGLVAAAISVTAFVGLLWGLRDWRD
jgi:predicted MFS family arabinose efflux permease